MSYIWMLNLAEFKFCDQIWLNSTSNLAKFAHLEPTFSYLDANF